MIHIIARVDYCIAIKKKCTIISTITIFLFVNHFDMILKTLYDFLKKM